MAEESYEDLLDFFEKEKDGNSSVDLNLNSDGSYLQSCEEENNVNVSHESSKVLTDIENILNESSAGTDVSDTEEQQIKRVEVEKAPEETSEILEAKNTVAGPGGVKRKAEDDLEDLLAADSNTKSSKLENAGGDNQDEGEDVDDRLLDGEDDEDLYDDNMSFEQMAALLDQEEEEESQEGTETEGTGVPGTETPQITRSQISRRLRELKMKYKDVLQQVCNMYDMKWPISSIDPIVYRDPDDKTGTKILGIEGLQEYVDNQHPLWGFDRDTVHRLENNPMNPMMSGYVLSEHVRTRWGKQSINPRSSLVVLEGCDEEENLAASNTNQNLQPKTEDGPEMDLHRRAIKTIMEMDIDAIRQEVLEKEKERKKLYQQKVYPLFYNVKNDEKIRNSENSETLYDFTERIRGKAVEKNWSMKRADEVIAGTQEAAEMASHYTGGETGVSEEQGDIILDMEEAYDKILEISADEKAEDENKNNQIRGFMNKEYLENA